MMIERALLYENTMELDLAADWEYEFPLVI